MAGSTKVTRTMYDCVKLMLKSKASAEDIVGYFNISKSTVYRILNSETFDEYHERVRADLYMKQKKAKEAQEAKEKAEAEAVAKAVSAVPAAPAAAQPVLTDMQMKGGALSANYQMNRMYDAVKQLNETMTLISNKLAFIVEELTK